MCSFLSLIYSVICVGIRLWRYIYIPLGYNPLLLCFIVQIIPIGTILIVPMKENTGKCPNKWLFAKHGFLEEHVENIERRAYK